MRMRHFAPLATALSAFAFAFGGTPGFAGDSATYVVDRDIDRVHVANVVVSVDDTGAHIVAGVTTPACPGLSRLSGRLTLTWTSQNDQIASHTFYLYGGIVSTTRQLSFTTSGDFGVAAGGGVEVTGHAGCTGD